MYTLPESCLLSGEGVGKGFPSTNQGFSSSRKLEIKRETFVSVIGIVSAGNGKWHTTTPVILSHDFFFIFLWLKFSNNLVIIIHLVPKTNIAYTKCFVFSPPCQLYLTLQQKTLNSQTVLGSWTSIKCSAQDSIWSQHIVYLNIVAPFLVNPSCSGLFAQ